MRLILSLVLVGVTLALYAQCATFQFTTWDDPFFITDNPVVQQGLSIDNLGWAFTAVSAGTWQPVTWLSHMLDCQLFGLNPAGHHLVNVLFHLANTLLIFLLLHRWTGSPWRSGLVAALFAIHPLHVESVAWLAERRDVLSTFWWLLTMWSYAGWVKRGGGRRYGLVMVCFALGLMSKPMLVTVPLVLVLLDIWPIRRVRWAGMDDDSPMFRGVAGLLPDKLPLLGLALGAGVITIIAEDRNASLGALSQYSLYFRVANALISYVRYLWQTVWPFDLIPFYPYPATIPAWQSGGALVLLVVVTLLCLRRLHDLPFLLVGWAWYLVTLLPVIGLIQQGTGFALADRYTYVPLLGIFMMVAWGGAALVEKWRCPRWCPVLACAGALLGCGWISHAQIGYWRDTRTLFSHTLTVDPINRVALNQLGVEARARGDLDEAYRFLAKAAALYPRDFDAQAHLASLLEAMGRLDQAITQYGTALKIRPDSLDCYLNMGVIRVKQERLEEAVQAFTMALGLQPENVKARINLGLALYMRRLLPEAEREFKQALTIAPDLGDAYNGLGLVAMEQGEREEAIRYFQTALRLNPDARPVMENLRDALGRR